MKVRLKILASAALILTTVTATAGIMLPNDVKSKVGSHNPLSPEDIRFQTKNITKFELKGTKVLALTFDDGPNPETTPAILDILKAYNVKASFFVVARRAKNHREILRRIRDEGHVLANHSYNHSLLNQSMYLTPANLFHEVADVHYVIKDFVQPYGRLYFRAPGGAWKAEHAARLNADPVMRNYIGPVYWDIGGELKRGPDGSVTAAADWACWSTKTGVSINTCLHGYLNETRSKRGGVVLLHDIHAGTVEMFRRMLPILIQEGYSFVTMDQIHTLEQYL